MPQAQGAVRALTYRLRLDVSVKLLAKLRGSLSRPYMTFGSSIASAASLIFYRLGERLSPEIMGPHETAVGWMSLAAVVVSFAMLSRAWLSAWSRPIKGTFAVVHRPAPERAPASAAQSPGNRCANDRGKAIAEEPTRHWSYASGEGRLA